MPSPLREILGHDVETPADPRPPPTDEAWDAKMEPCGSELEEAVDELDRKLSAIAVFTDTGSEFADLETDGSEPESET